MLQQRSHSCTREAEVVSEKLRDLRPILEKQEGELTESEQSLLNALREHVDCNQDSLKRLRDCYEDLMYWEYALETERKLQDLTQPDTIERADCLYRQGKLFMRMQQVLPGSRLYQQALEVYERHDGGNVKIAIGNVKISMAGVQYHRQNFENAIKILLQAESYFPADHPDLIKCLQHQGLLYRTIEDFGTALNKYERALQLADQLGLEIEGLKLDMADMHLAMENFDKALPVYQAVLESCTEQATEAVLLHNIGKILAQQGQHKEAVEKLTRAVNIKRKLGGEFNPEVAKTLNLLGAIESFNGNKRAALECFQESLMILRASADSQDDPQIFYALRNIAVVKGEKVPKWGSEDDER